MFLYVCKRLFLMLPTAFGVILLTFLLLHIVPGDPVEVLLGEHALPADREEMRKVLGLNQPIITQFGHFLSSLVQGDLGQSFYNGKNVTSLIWQRLPATLMLGAGALTFALLLAFPLGVWAAAHKKKWQDKTALTISMLGFSMPAYWLGPMLMVVFSVWLGLFPVSGFDGSLKSLILPSITLGFAMSAMTARLIRGSMLEVWGEDYIRTGQAKGASFNRLFLHHTLRNALLPVITIVFLQIGALMTGAILTEAVFSWPGLGSLIVESLQRRDYPVIQGCVLFIAFVYMGVTFLSDLIYGFADPRVRHGGAR